MSPFADQNVGLPPGVIKFRVSP